MISSVAGTTPAATMAPTAWAAASTVAKVAANVRRATGRGISRTVTSVMMASVPSDPTSRSVRA